MDPSSPAAADEPALLRWHTDPLPSRTLRSRTTPLPPKLDVRLVTNGDHTSTSGSSGSSYTSIKDLLHHSPANSPTTFNRSGDIPIKNPLVKQAAYAYLQPKASPCPARSRVWLFGREMSGDGPCSGCIGFISHLFHRLLAVVQKGRSAGCWLRGNRCLR